MAAVRENRLKRTPSMHRQYRMSQELWIWAKEQVLSSLRAPYGLEKLLPALKKAATGTDDHPRPPTIAPLPARPSAAAKVPNLVKAPRTHQDLHRELLLTHRKGLVLHSKPELLRVLEKRRCQERDGEEPAQGHAPLQKELQRWQQRREEKQQKEAQEEKVSSHEFVKVRENLKKTARRGAQSPQTSSS